VRVARRKIQEARRGVSRSEGNSFVALADVERGNPKNRSAGRFAISVSSFTGSSFERARLRFGAPGRRGDRLGPRKTFGQNHEFRALRETTWNLQKSLT